MTHRIVTNIGVFNGPLTSVRLATPFVLGAPLHGTSWLAANGPANDTGHRRAVTEINGRLANAQRFAIDWVKIDSRGATFSGNRKVNASYYAYGQDVLAVADGIVASVKDGIPENVPADPPAVPIDLTTIAGNFIVLDVGNGAYVVYAHLQPGSLRVRPGDSVQRGTPLARLGNSGNSTEPHLHLHVCDANSNIACDGLPYVFDHFRSSGVTRTLEIPLRNELVDFD
ncbi:MAG: M23 family metallopeptidase [Acidobacteriota bacterium]|nr:M23 family metallopeptidase [Acidobacteriota bacterium]